MGTLHFKDEGVILPQIRSVLLIKDCAMILDALYGRVFMIVKKHMLLLIAMVNQPERKRPCF